MSDDDYDDYYDDDFFYYEEDYDDAAVGLPCAGSSFVQLTKIFGIGLPGRARVAVSGLPRRDRRTELYRG
jgi:hypothetical protein